MTAIDTGLQDLKRQHPEWEPWLAVIQEILSEAANPKWDAVVPVRTEAQQDKVPLLAGATLGLEKSSVRRVLERLIRIAYRSGTPKMATLEPTLHAELDILTLFKMSVCQDTDRIGETAAFVGADSEAFQAVVALLPVPFLQACNRHWAPSIAKSWEEGYCSVCGAWPAFAEVRGIERSRYFRCGRCGGEWHARALWGPYCDTSDHHNFLALVPENGGLEFLVGWGRGCFFLRQKVVPLRGGPPGAGGGG